MGYLKMAILGALSIVCICMHSNQQIVQMFSEPKWQPHDHGIWRGLFELITVTTVTTARLDLMASNCW